LGQTISAGLYTLRSAPNRDFLLLIPAASDAGPNALFKFPDLVALS